MIDAPLLWSPGTTYVVGHQHPDSDAIGSALGYAWFLAATGTPDVQAARCGRIGTETAFALKYFDQAPPPLLQEVYPTFAHIGHAVEPIDASAPLVDALHRMAAGLTAVPVMQGEKVVGAVTPRSLARAFTSAAPGQHVVERACGEVVEKIPQVEHHERLDDFRDTLVRGDDEHIAVLHDDGRCNAIASRKDFLLAPRARLVLVDHNELAQAVEGAETADIVSVLDHHRLGNPPTTAPIRFIVEPIGSTCTLVTEQCRARGLQPPRGLLGMLLTAILSDTLVFHSPTCTPRDREAAAWLGGLLALDVEAYGVQMLDAEPGLSADVDEIVDGDRKPFKIGKSAVSLAQVEVTGLKDLPRRRDALLAALDERRTREALDLIALMVTDVVSCRSHLLCRGDKRLLARLPFSSLVDGEFDVDDMVSRKKQLVPAITAALGG